METNLSENKNFLIVNKGELNASRQTFLYGPSKDYDNQFELGWAELKVDKGIVKAVKWEDLQKPFWVFVNPEIGCQCTIVSLHFIGRPKFISK
jgi:hypothetical protein